MRIPSTDKESNELVRIGLYHLTGLERVEETAEFARAFREVNDGLRKAWAARVSAEEDLAPRIALVFHIDVEMDGQILAFGDAVKTHDREAGSEVFGQLFPNGLERVIVPVGALETTAIRQILDRLQEASNAGDLPGWSDPLGKTLAEYETAIRARDEADGVLKKALAAEDAAREAWFAATDKQCAVVDQSYPDSDATRALFFPAGS